MVDTDPTCEGDDVDLSGSYIAETWKMGSLSDYLIHDNARLEKLVRESLGQAFDTSAWSGLTKAPAFDVTSLMGMKTPALDVTSLMGMKTEGIGRRYERQTEQTHVPGCRREDERDPENHPEVQYWHGPKDVLGFTAHSTREDGHVGTDHDSGAARNQRPISHAGSSEQHGDHNTNDHQRDEQRVLRQRPEDEIGRAHV